MYDLDPYISQFLLPDRLLALPKFLDFKSGKCNCMYTWLHAPPAFAFLFQRPLPLYTTS
jgi:hypothetical protein